MKTSITKKGILLRSALLIAALGWTTITSATCQANFTYTVGINGFCSFTSTSKIDSSYTMIYTWTPGDGGNPYISFSNTYSHTYLKNGTYSVVLYIQSDSNLNCSDSITIPVTINNVDSLEPCTLNPSFSVSYSNNGQVTFTSTSQGVYANTLYYWSPGDSNQRILGSTSYTHTYLWNGTYFVWLTLNDTGAGYCLDSTYEYITVTNADSSQCKLKTNFTYTLGAGGQVTFTSTSTGLPKGPVEYSWSPGDTTGPYNYYNNKSFTYTYSFNGVYTVLLWIQGDSNYCYDSISIPVTITNACNIAADFTVTYDSSGEVTFNSTSQGVNAKTVYDWSSGDSAYHDSGTGITTYTHSYPFIGTYNVTLTIIDSSGCQSSITIPIYVYNKDSLLARFVYQQDTDSVNSGTYYFYSTSLGTNQNTYYRWDPGDGSPADSGIQMTYYTHTYTKNGPYNATLTVWYTILPLHRRIEMIHYDESSYTLIIYVNMVVGLNSLSSNTDGVTIYPNPSTGTFNIKASGLEGQRSEVKITDLLGQVIYNDDAVPVSYGQFNVALSLHDIPSGMYFIEILSGGTAHTMKAIIEK